jgi:hypothetical protein
MGGSKSRLTECGLLGGRGGVRGEEPGAGIHESRGAPQEMSWVLSGC